MTERQWQQVGGAGGIFSVVVLIGLVVSIALTTSTPQPAFDGPAQDWLAYTKAANASLVPRTVVGQLAIVGFLLFAVAIAVRLRTSDGHLSVPSILVLLSAGIAMTLDMTGSGITLAAFFRTNDLDATTAGLLSGLYNGVSVTLGFAFAGMLVAAGVGALQTQALPRWLAWLGIVAGISWLGAGLAPTTSLRYLPYLAWLVWVVAVSIALLRSRRDPMTS